MRGYHLGAGPTALPGEVFFDLHDATFNFAETHESVLQIPHRAPEFEDMVAEIDPLVRELLSVPNDYAILLIPGGATAAYTHSLGNFLHRGRRSMRCGFLVGGMWSKEFFGVGGDLAEEGLISCELLATTMDRQGHFYSLPKISNELIDRMNALDCVVFCSNETVHGMQYHDLSWLAHVKALKVCDMSSDLFTRRINVANFDLIFASTAKNLGIPASLALVIVRKDRLASNFEESRKFLPIPMRYLEQMKPRSRGALRNTPCTPGLYSIYLTLQWIRRNGGVSAMQLANFETSRRLYEAIDNSTCFQAPIPKEYRSRINTVCRVRYGLHDEFLKHCREKKFKWIHGYHGVEPNFGGPHLRISANNATCIEGKAIPSFIKTMHEFEEVHLKVSA
jgi:phosphoserine aminotransferase